jgi:hypothetical protein
MSDVARFGGTDDGTGLAVDHRHSGKQGLEQWIARAKIADPENRLLWRMNLRRLEAEIVRDAVIAASGKLDSTMGGPPIRTTGQ